MSVLYIFSKANNIMIHKIQNIHGTVYLVDGMNKNFLNELEDVLLKIIEDKKQPFNSIYLKFPIFVSNHVSAAIENLNIKPKNMMKKKNEIILEF